MTVYDKNDVNKSSSGPLAQGHPGMCVWETTSSWLSYLIQIAKIPNSRDVRLQGFGRDLEAHSIPPPPGDSRLLPALG